MKRNHWLAGPVLMLALGALATGCRHRGHIVVHTPAPAPVVVAPAPAVTVEASSDYATVYPSSFAPEPIPEYRPAPPGYGYTWVDGYWDWTGATGPGAAATGSPSASATPTSAPATSTSTGARSTTAATGRATTATASTATAATGALRPLPGGARPRPRHTSGARSRRTRPGVERRRRAPCPRRHLAGWRDHPGSGPRRGGARFASSDRGRVPRVAWSATAPPPATTPPPAGGGFRGSPAAPRPVPRRRPPAGVAPRRVPAPALLLRPRRLRRRWGRPAAPGGAALPGGRPAWRQPAAGPRWYAARPGVVCRPGNRPVARPPDAFRRRARRPGRRACRRPLAGSRALRPVATPTVPRARAPLVPVPPWAVATPTAADARRKTPVPGMGGGNQYRPAGPGPAGPPPPWAADARRAPPRPVAAVRPDARALGSGCSRAGPW
jgi:hypothetical protein